MSRAALNAAAATANGLAPLPTDLLPPPAAPVDPAAVQLKFAATRRELAAAMIERDEEIDKPKGTTMPPQTGYTGKVIVHFGLAIKERVVRVAYAQNGNAYNPTVYKAWDVWDRTRETERLLLRCETLREAKRFCETGKV